MAPPPGPALYRLAAERMYNRVPEHVRSHPQDILWRDRYGSTALHILCQIRFIDDALLEAVHAILQEAPHQAAWPNIATWTPLHFACEKRLLWGNNISNTELVLQLIQACPKAVSIRMTNGFKAKTPFHISCEVDASMEILRAMLRVDPSLATESYGVQDVYSITESPLHLLWNATTKSNGHNSAGNANQLRLSEEKMELLLRAAYCGTVQEGNDNDRHHPPFRLLNATCSIRCPKDYVSRVLQTHAAEIRQIDQQGYLPLHYVIENAQEDSPSYTRFLLEHLLEEYPTAASVPFGGTSSQNTSLLPLHVILTDRAMTWDKGGVQLLTMAYTDALRIPDPRNHLVPFLASAVHATKSRLHLSTTLELLLAAPEMIAPPKQQHLDSY